MIILDDKGELTMDYKVVDKPETVSHKNIYKELFDKLPNDKAIQFTFLNKDKAHLKGKCINRTLKYYQAKYNTHYTVYPDNDKFILLVWKESK